MAYVLWTNHPYNKNLNGTKEHVAVSVAESAFQFKQAVPAPRPRYGTPEWLAERAEASKSAVPDKHDTVVTPVVGTEWFLMTTPEERQLLVRKSGFETTFFPTVQQALAAGCPKNIADRFVPDEVRKTNREIAAETSEQARIKAEQQQKRENTLAHASMWR